MIYISRLVAVVLAVAMAEDCGEVVEMDLVGRISVEKTRENPPTLSFSGDIMDSYRGVTAIRIEREKRQVNVFLVHGVGGRADFHFDVDISDGIETVTLGRRKAVIWTK